jgi:hypothetical protein
MTGSALTGVWAEIWLSTQSGINAKRRIVFTDELTVEKKEIADLVSTTIPAEKK